MTSYTNCKFYNVDGTCREIDYNLRDIKELPKCEGKICPRKDAEDSLEMFVACLETVQLAIKEISNLRKENSDLISEMDGYSFNLNNLSLKLQKAEEKLKQIQEITNE